MPQHKDDDMKKVILITMLIFVFFGFFQPYVIVSGSMEPEIPTGSIVFVNNSFAPGDIVTYTHAGQTVTHRILKKTGDEYILKGDANRTADLGIVKETDIQGKVILVIPFLGTILIYARNYFIFAVPIILISNIFKIRKKRKKETKNI